MTGDAFTDEDLAAQERFDTGASRYADYLRTTEGRLRLELAWANLRALLNEATGGGDLPGGAERHALDVGGGTGALALRLVAEGWRVAVVDSSEPMLALAAEAVRQSGLPAHVSFHQGDATSVGALFPGASFDLAVCHNVLEYVADPASVVRAMSAALRPGGLASILARNRAGEVLRAAIKSHDLAAARVALEAETVSESLYGGPAKLFDHEHLRALASQSGLVAVAERGVRVLTDYLPATLTENAQAYQRLFDFELELGTRANFAAVARYAQLIARRV